jgi:hypothetical protein
VRGDAFRRNVCHSTPAGGSRTTHVRDTLERVSPDAPGRSSNDTCSGDIAARWGAAASPLQNGQPVRVWVVAGPRCGAARRGTLAGPSAQCATFVERLLGSDAETRSQASQALLDLEPLRPFQRAGSTAAWKDAHHEQDAWAAQDGATPEAGTGRAHLCARRRQSMLRHNPECLQPRGSVLAAQWLHVSQSSTIGRDVVISAVVAFALLLVACACLGGRRAITRRAHRRFE